MNKIILLGLCLLFVSSVSAYSLGEYMYDMNLSNASDVRCVDFNEAIYLNTGWNNSVYCADNMTSEIVYVQGNFTYSHQSNYGDDSNEIPEFGVIAGVIALIGCIGIYVVRKV